MLIFAAMPAAARDMQKAYTDEELAAVREWEKTWAGKKIDHTNVDHVAQFMLESVVTIIKHPDRWGAPPEGFFFTIRPYAYIAETPNYIAASMASAGRVKLAQDGSMENLAELAGRLFMDPGEDGQKMAWNFEMQNRGDTFQYRKHALNVNPGNRSEVLTDQGVREYFFINRTEVDPRPAVEKNPRGYRRGIFLQMFTPSELFNSSKFTLRYIDQSKQDDVYQYFSRYRRIRHAHRSARAPTDGSDIIGDDDAYLWDGQLLRNTYTYRGKRDLLTDRHDGVGRIRRIEGQVFSNDMTFERCNLLVIDAINKDRNYRYSKRVWYLDPETYYIMWTEMYDWQGRFWKMFFNSTQPLKSNTGVMKPVIVGTHFFDLHRTHGALANHQKISEPAISDVNMTAEIFTTEYLLRDN